MPQLSIPTLSPERAGLPGVLTQLRSQAQRKDKPLSETARPTNTTDNYMARGKCKNISNRNQGYLASSEPSSFITASPRYLKILEKQDSDLKSHLMVMIQDFKKVINNTQWEIQAHKSLK